MDKGRDVAETVRRALISSKGFAELVESVSRPFHDTLIFDEAATIRILTESIENTGPQGTIKVLSASMDKEARTVSVQVEMPKWMHDRMFNE